MNQELTLHEQQQVDTASKLHAERLYQSEFFADKCASDFKAGINFALQHLLPGRMEKFAEWISLKGLYQEIDLKWYDKFGGKVRLVAETTAELWPLYEKYQETLKQQQDEQSEKGS